MNLTEWMDNKIVPVMAKVGSQRHVVAIRDGVVINVLPGMIGSLFLLIASLPIPGYTELLRDNGIYSKLLIVVSSTMDITGLTATMAVAYRLAESYKSDALSSAVLSVICFFLLTPQTLAHEAVEGGLITGVMSMTWFSAKGLFTGLFVALTATELYRKFISTNFVITMPESVPPAVARSFASLIPGGLTIIIFWGIRMLVDASSYENIHTLISELLTDPLKGVSGSLGGAILYMFLIHFFWFFGIHGHLVLGPILDPMFAVLSYENRIAFQNGEVIPNIVTRYWLDLYGTMGGSGASLSIIVVLFLFARSQHLKSVGRLALGPGMFNINEPFLFGVPIIFNLQIIFPFILAPIANVCSAYFMTVIGFLPKHNGLILPWTTPIFISGFMIAGWRGLVMQIINFLLSGFVWYIFIKRLDNLEYQKELESLKDV